MSRGLFQSFSAWCRFVLKRGNGIVPPVHPHPTAKAEANPTSQYVGEPVQFSDSSYEVGGTLVKWEWDWNNDGTYEAEGRKVEHTWDTPGSYKVQFKVTDSEGQFDLLDNPLEIRINPKPSDKLNPIAMAQFDPDPQLKGFPVHFSGAESYDPDGSIVKYEWDWNNDGVFDSEGEEADHTWDSPGVYEVQLRVTDNDGLSGTLHTLLQVEINDSVNLNPVDITPGSLSMHSTAVYVDGIYLYVADTAYKLDIFDISNPGNPVWVNTISLPEQPTNLTVANGYAYITSSGSGLMIANVSDPKTAHWLSSASISPKAKAVAIYNGYAYVACDTDGVQVVDIGTPEAPKAVTSIYTQEHAQDLQVVDGYLYEAGEQGNLYVIDVNNLSAVKIVKTVVTGFHNMGGIIISGDRAYGASSDGGILVFDISTPSSTNLKFHMSAKSAFCLALCNEDIIWSNGGGSMAISDMTTWDVLRYFTQLGKVMHIAVAGNYAYLSNNITGLEVLDLTNPASAYLSDRIQSTGYSTAVAADGDYAYAAGDKFQILNIHDPVSPFIVSETKLNYTAEKIELYNGYAYILTGTQTQTGDFEIVDVDPPDVPHNVAFFRRPTFWTLKYPADIFI